MKFLNFLFVNKEGVLLQELKNKKLLKFYYIFL